MTTKTGNQVGEIAPDFALIDAAGEIWRLSEKRGKIVVLLFYPADNTPVCTKQLCSVRDNWSAYQATGAEVVGISTDSVESHRNFAERYDLPLRLLADNNGEATRMLDVKSWLPNRSARAVFVIDKQGIIRHRKVQVLGIVRPKDEDVLAAIRKANSE